MYHTLISNESKTASKIFVVDGSTVVINATVETPLEKMSSIRTTGSIKSKKSIKFDLGDFNQQGNQGGDHEGSDSAAAAFKTETTQQP